MNGSDHVELIAELEVQAYQLYTTIQSLNPHFWRLLFDHADCLVDQGGDVQVRERRGGRACSGCFVQCVG